MPNFKASDGRSISYFDTEGAGPTVLCLAALTRDSRDFADLADHLGDAYRVVSMDYRGRGESEWAKDPITEYQPMIEGRDAIEMLAHLQITQSTIIGTSRGGLIGMGLAAHMPESVRALILNDVGPEISESGVRLIMSYLGRPLSYPDFSAAAHGLQALFEEDFPTVTEADWMKFAKRIFHDQNGRPVLSYDNKLRDAVQAVLDGPPVDLWPVFEAIRCPILLIRGGNSSLLTKNAVEKMQTAQPEMTMVEIPDRGHCPFLDEPDAVEAIDTFLERRL